MSDSGEVGRSMDAEKKRALCPVKSDDCPSPNQLNEFCQGIGDVDSAEQLANKIEQCATCESFVSQFEKLQVSKWRQLNDPLESALVDTITMQSTFGSVASGKDSLAAGDKLGKYEILDVLGRGGMGVVYRAQDPTLERKVALKTIRTATWASEEAVGMFVREAHAAARLEHAGIVPVFDIGIENDLHYLTMQLIDGPNLHEAAKQNQFSFAEIADIVRQVADAVSHAHSRSIVHRDLKPQNILLTEDCLAKVTDFGLAKQLDDDAGNTRTGDLRGTPSYMAPEQAAGDTSAIGYCTDVYAIGAILYFLLTDRPPFQKETLGKTLQSVIHDEPLAPTQLNSKCPKDLQTVCLKCLSKSPSHRYASAKLLSDDLECFLRGAPVQARPVSTIEKTWRWSVRNPVPATLAVMTTVLAVAIVIGSYYFASLRSRDVASNTRKLELANQFDESLANASVTTEQLRRLEAISAELAELDPDRDGDRRNRLIAKATSDAIDKLGRPRITSDLETEIKTRIGWLQDHDQSSASELAARLDERKKRWSMLLGMDDLVKGLNDHFPASIVAVKGKHLVSTFPKQELGPSRIPLRMPVPKSFRLDASIGNASDAKQLGIAVSGLDAEGNRSEIEFLLRREQRHTMVASEFPFAENAANQTLEISAAWTHPGVDGIATAPAFAFSPDRRFIAFADGRHAVKVVDVQTGESVQRVEGLTDAGFALLYQGREPTTQETIEQQAANPFSNASYHLMAIGIAPIRIIRFTPEGELRQVVSLSHVDDLLRAVDGPSKQVAFASGDRLHVRSWENLESRQSVSVDARKVTFSPTGSHIAFMTDKDEVFLWNLSRSRPDQLAIHSRNYESVNFTGDGRVLVVGSTTNSALLFDVDTGAEVGKCNLPSPCNIFSGTTDGLWHFASTGGPGFVCFDHLVRKVHSYSFERNDRAKSLGQIAPSADGTKPGLIAVRHAKGDVELFHWKPKYLPGYENDAARTRDLQLVAHVRQAGATIRTMTMPTSSNSSGTIRISCLRESGRLEFVVDGQKLLVQDQLLMPYSTNERLLLDLPNGAMLNDFSLMSKTQPKQPSLLEKAALSLQQLDYESAAKLYQAQIDAAEEENVRNDCKLKLGQCLELLGQKDEASRIFTELIAEKSEPWTKAAMVHQWLIAIDEKDESLRAMIFAKIRNSYKFKELVSMLSDAERHRIIQSTPTSARLNSVATLLRSDPTRIERLEQSLLLLKYVADDAQWRYPTHDVVGMQIWLARAYQMEDNLPKAVQIMRRLYDEHIVRPDTTENMLLWIVEEFSRCQRLGDAGPGDAESNVLRVIKRFGQTDPHWKLVQERSRCLAQLGRNEEGLRYLENTLQEIDRESSRAHISLTLLAGAMAEKIGDVDRASRLFQSGANRFQSELHSVSDFESGLLLRGLMLKSKCGEVSNDDFFRVASLWWDPNEESQATSIVNFAKSISGSLDFGAAFQKAWQTKEGQHDFWRLATDYVSLSDRYRIPLVRLGLELTDAGAFKNQASPDERDALMALMNRGYDGIVVRGKGSATIELGGAFAINLGAAWKFATACQFMLATGLPNDDQIASGVAFVLGVRHENKNNLAVARQAFQVAVDRSPNDWPFGSLAKDRLEELAID